MAHQRFTRVASRIASRALLVAGFAGAAWLLSSAAAHAASAQSPTAGTERGVVSLTAPVTRTAVDLLGTVLPVRPASRAASPAAPERHAAVRGRDIGPIPLVFDLLRPLTGALTGPGAGTLTDLLSPMTGRVQPRSTAGTTAARTAVRVATPPAAVPHIEVTPVATRTPARRPAATGHPAVRATRPTSDAGTRQVPGLPDRTPAPAYPDSGNTGISTTASGSHLDGGAFAAGTQLPGRLYGRLGGLAATEAPVRLLLAEAPIFSPD